MQAPLAQDASVSATKKMVRIVTIDIATGATKEFGYKLTSGSGVSEITAINDHEFLIDERDGKGRGDGSAAVVKQLFRIDLSGAIDITNLSGAAAANASVGKTLFLDLLPSLSAALGGATQVPSKIEGYHFWPRRDVRRCHLPHACSWPTIMTSSPGMRGRAGCSFTASRIAIWPG